MKRIIYLTVFLSLVVVTQSQQLMTSSFYDMYGILHNPASSGSQQHAIVGSMFKTQWNSMPGSPQTGLIFASTYLRDSKLGIGGYMYTDVTGPVKWTGLRMAYAYHIPLEEERIFSIGLESRFLQFSYDRSKLRESLGIDDPVLSSNEKRFKGDVGAGIAYTSSKFVLGAAVSQLVQSKLKLYESGGSQSDQAKLYRHYYVHSNYYWSVDSNTRIIPHISLVYLPNAPLEVQGGIRAEYNNQIWYGLSRRARQGWMVSAGVKVKKKFNIGYSFDIYKTPLSIYSRGSESHEIMLQYDFIQ